MPKIFADENAEIGDEISVFVYQDDSALKATTEIPLCEVGEFAVMTCVQSLPSGAFMDWGIIKDLFIPYKQQKGKILEGKRYLVYVYVDDVSDRITGTTKFKRNQSYENVPFKRRRSKSYHCRRIRNWFQCNVVNKKIFGLNLHFGCFQKLYPLSEEKGYIKTIREDSKIDVTLQKKVMKTIMMNFNKNSSEIRRKLRNSLSLRQIRTQEIKQELQMSKKNFKRQLAVYTKTKS